MVWHCFLSASFNFVWPTKFIAPRIRNIIQVVYFSQSQETGSISFYSQHKQRHTHTENTWLIFISPANNWHFCVIFIRSQINSQHRNMRWKNNKITMITILFSINLIALNCFVHVWYDCKTFNFLKHKREKNTQNARKKPALFLCTQIRFIKHRWC